MWGTPILTPFVVIFLRFIPTDVGNTCLPLNDLSCISVHPHRCGEHHIANAFSLFYFGSSPQMWGTLLYLAKINLGTRFIPTDVGNTDTERFYQQFLSVHPHRCGEHLFFIIESCAVSGSSPQMWGTQHHCYRNS